MKHLLHYRAKGRQNLELEYVSIFHFEQLSHFLIEEMEVQERKKFCKRIIMIARVEVTSQIADTGPCLYLKNNDNLLIVIVIPSIFECFQCARLFTCISSFTFPKTPRGQVLAATLIEELVKELPLRKLK